MSERAVVIGDALIDELRDDQGVREFVGGAGLNVAVGLSRLGVPTTLIAMVGDDEAGERIRSFLAEHQVDLLVTRGPRGSSRAVSIRSAGGEPQYEFNEAAWNRAISFGEAERAAIAEASIVAVSCFPFDNAGQTEQLAAALAAGDALLAIDPNPRAGMMHDPSQFVRGYESLAVRAALVKVGDDDAEMLHGRPLAEVSARLGVLGAGAVLATRGADGAELSTGSWTASRPVSALPGRIVDTMGAGDASFATVVAALIPGFERHPDAWGAVLQDAMDNAAATCRSEGALLRRPDDSATPGPADAGM